MVYFINPPFKWQYGKFSRESRSPSIGHSGVLYYPLWLIYSAAYCEENGLDIRFLDAPAAQLSDSQCLEIIKQEKNVDLFVVDTSTPSIFSDVSFCEKLKERFPKCYICLVGTHPTATVEETFNISEAIDFIARREYDQIILDLANQIISGKKDFSNVDGLSYRSNGEIINNKDANLITDLDKIPFASKFIFEHLNVFNYVFPAASFPAIQIFTGRGCPAHCTFCVYPQVMHGHVYRKRSAKNVVDELIYISEHFPKVKEIVFEDDTFTIDKKRLLEICDLMIEYKLNKRFKWLCNARANLDCETMKKMKKAGCRLIIPGIESFNQEILNNIKKGTTLQTIEDYIHSAKKAKLLVHACYMVGNMGETKETMQNTLKAALRFKTDTAQFFPLIPYPGTEEYRWAKENGYITKTYSEYCKEDGTLNCVLNEPDLTGEEMVQFCDYARKKYYLRPWYIFHRLWVGLKHPSDLKRSLKAFSVMKKFLFKKKSK